MLDKIIFLAHVLSTFMMFGIIWLIQIAHYPLLSFIGKNEFVKYKKEYNRRIMPVAIVVLSVELFTGVLLVWFRPPNIPNWQVFSGIQLLAIIWILTWFVEVPQHKILESDFNKKSHITLVKANLIRAVAWTGRAILVSMMIINVI